ncbi:MAG: DUF1957 domain-containing protein [Actinobacteria bacterium]|nr:DUF1957 domain-containing protein [Actinomycetota bacterium]
MADAGIVLLLHSHMPYVRRNGDWPVGEEWLLEAWAESYLPIWRIIEELTAGALPGKLALTMTPVLAEQLRDGYLEERLDGYLKNKIDQTLQEMDRLGNMGDEPRRKLASFFGAFYRDLLRDFEERFRGRMLKVLAEGMDAGVLEVLASAATHGHLPTLGSTRSRMAQIEIGLESYRRCFGRDPRGFWLPECAYTPEIDAALTAFSPPLSYVILDFYATGSPPGEAPTWLPQRLGSTPLLALIRDEVAHDLVWTMWGYPAGGDYREYNKRDVEGHGFQYWRITSGFTPLDEKDIYHPENAVTLAKADARDFAAKMRSRKEAVSVPELPADAHTLVLAAYDTELMGHWWREGPVWLHEVLRLLAGETMLPGDLAEGFNARDVSTISPAMTAWSVDGSFSVWVNQGTRDIWEHTYSTEEDFASRLPSASMGGEKNRALIQAARELLLVEASDWSFLISRDTAAGYARDRFASHLARYREAIAMFERGKIDADLLSELEDTDNIFPWLDLRYWK